MDKELKTVGDVKSFVIDRAKWYRGKYSQLLGSRDMKCCLGFYALACGVDKKTIRGLGSPSDVVNLDVCPTAVSVDVTRRPNVKWETRLVKRVRSKFGAKDTSITDQLMVINDSKSIDDVKRESKITSLFKKIGIKVKFKG